MATEYETTEAPIGSLDWWMGTLTPEITAYERTERARLMKIVFQSWKDARNIQPPEQGMPANFVCGCLLDAAAALMSKSRSDVLRLMDRWAEKENSEYIEPYFANAWKR